MRWEFSRLRNVKCTRSQCNGMHTHNDSTHSLFVLPANFAEQVIEFFGIGSSFDGDVSWCETRFNLCNENKCIRKWIRHARRELILYRSESTVWMTTTSYDEWRGERANGKRKKKIEKRKKQNDKTHENVSERANDRTARSIWETCSRSNCQFKACGRMPFGWQFLLQGRDYSTNRNVSVFRIDRRAYIVTFTFAISGIQFQM